MDSDLGNFEFSYKFCGAEIAGVDGYAQFQQAIMPLVGISGEAPRALASCLVISSSPLLAVTAWHAVEGFVEESRRVGDHPYCLAAIYETNRWIPNTNFDFGGPIPVSTVLHQQGTGVGLLVLSDVIAGSNHMLPSVLGPVCFDAPLVGDFCYAVGYPHLRAETKIEKDAKVLDFERIAKITGGRVQEVFPLGQPGHSMVKGPSLRSDFPVPGGLSGGPVATGQSGPLWNCFNIDRTL